MKKIKSILMLTLLLMSNSFVKAQYTALDFQGVDCNNNQVHLFNDLDNGKFVVLYFYMANCGSCIPKANDIQIMANNINANNPNLVKGYAFPYTNTTTCSYSADWVQYNNLQFYAPMDSGTVHVTNYGGFGMPTVVLLGGDNREVLFVTQDYTSADTTTMKNLILGNSSLTNLDKNNFEVKIFPNPASDFVNLTFNSNLEKEINISISTLDGKLIKAFSKEEINLNNNNLKIPLNQIDNGTYLIQLISGDIKTTKILNVKR